MPLILAVNPAGSQSPTLARLARELKGCELIGAESCAVAIQALDQHAPDLVLLPGAEAKGEIELMARLSAAPGAVPVLRLPPPAALDFKALVADVKALLAEPAGGGSAAPAGASPALLAAAAAAVDWIRTRRSIWAIEGAYAAEQEPVSASLASFAAPDSFMPESAGSASLPAEPVGPSLYSRAADAAGEWRHVGVAWFPRLTALAGLIALVSAGVIYWPSIRAGGASALATFTTSSRPEPVEPAATQAASAPRPDRSNAGPPAGAELRMSGWLAVFSPFEMSISEGNRSLALDDRSRVMLPPGPHKLRFRNTALGYDEVRTIQIRPTETTTLNLIPQTTLSVASSEPAEVWIDGNPAGQTPLVDHRIDVGAHTVMVRSASGEREFALEATAKPLQLDVDFSAQP
jgi:hypothetical protein